MEARYRTTTKDVIDNVQSCGSGDHPCKTWLAAALQLLVDLASFYMRYGLSIWVKDTMGKERAVELMQRLYPEEDISSRAEGGPVCCKMPICSPRSRRPPRSLRLFCSLRSL